MESRLGLMNSWLTEATPATDSAGPWKVRVRFPVDTTVKTKLSQAPPAPVRAQTPAARGPFDIALVIWGCGFAASLALLGCRYYQTRRLAAETRPATDERLMAIYSAISAQWRRNVGLRMTEVLNVPTLAGIFWPQIWMPESWLGQFTDDELRSILLHELGHARRGDLAVQWLFAFVQCLHWFNPLVWLAARAARFDREMACDAWVLSLDSSDSAPAYGATLLKTARLVRLARRPRRGWAFSESASAPSATVAMASSCQSLHVRVAGIGTFRPIRAWTGLLGVASMIATLALLTTSRTTGGEEVATPAVSAKETRVDSVAGVQPAAPQVSSTGGGVEGDLIRIRAKFVEMEDPAWKELCAEDPEFQKAADLINSKQDRYVSAGTKPYITNEPELNAFGTNKWLIKDGAWDTLGGIYGWDVLSAAQLLRILKSVAQLKGVDLLSAPTVTTRQ
jgi:hypothetical protein